MKIYINWDEREVKNENDFFELIEDHALEISQSDYTLDDFLSNYYGYEEIFYLDDEQKEQVINKYEKTVKEIAENSIFEVWEEYDTEEI